MTSRATIAERLLDLVDTVEHAVVVLARDWTYAYANPAARDLLGLDDSSLGRDVRHLHPAWVGSGFGPVFAGVLAGGPAQVVEEHDASLDTYLQASVHPLASGILVVLRDITRERRSQAVLLRDHALYQQVLDHAHSPMTLRDLDSRFLLVNASAAELAGRPAEEIVGTTVQELLGDDLGGSVRAVDLEVQRTGQVHEHVALVSPQRVLGRQLLAQVYPVHADDGRVVGTGTVITDVTQLNKKDADLATAHKRYHDVFTSTGLGILIVRDGDIIEANTSACRMVGRSRAQLMSMKATDLTRKSSVELAALGGELFDEGGLGVEVEDELVRSDGGLLPVLVTLNVLADPTDGAQLVSVLLRDRSQVKELQDRLVRSERMEAAGQLAAGVAHDFNNILAAISGYTELLAEEVAGVPAAGRHLAGIHRSIGRAGEMVSQLLAFTRGLHLSAERIDLRDLVLDLEDMLRQLLPPEVVLAVEAQHASAFVDATQVRQVLLNLVVNAKDALGPAGAVSVVTGVHQVAVGDPHLPAGSYAELTVTDDGPGMEQTVAHRCFEPFFSTRVTRGGTGLGLATAHGIALQSGGDLRVHTRPGEGAAFQLLLPSRGVVGIPAEECPARPEPASGWRPTAQILVADDDEECRQTVASALRACGHDVVEAVDGRAALRLSAAPDLLVTDVEMDGVGGPALAAALRRRDERLAVLFMSGHAAPPGIGGAPMLRKPFSVSALLDAVKLLLEGDRG